MKPRHSKIYIRESVDIDNLVGFFDIEWNKRISVALQYKYRHSKMYLNMVQERELKKEQALHDLRDKLLDFICPVLLEELYHNKTGDLKGKVTKGVYFYIDAKYNQVLGMVLSSKRLAEYVPKVSRINPNILPWFPKTPQKVTFYRRAYN